MKSILEIERESGQDGWMTGMGTNDWKRKVRD